LIWEVSKKGELRAINKTYDGNSALKTFIYKQTGYENGFYLRLLLRDRDTQFLYTFKVQELIVIVFI